MKDPLHRLMVVVMIASAATCHALTLAPGESIGVSFGATLPYNHFNPCDPNNPDILATGSLGSITDTNGVLLDGVTLQFGGSNVVASSEGTLQDFTNYGGLFSTENIENGVTGYDLSFAFTGLDNRQQFVLDIVSSYSLRNIGAEFFCNGLSILTDSTSTNGGTRAHFAAITPDGNGTITVTVTGHDMYYSSSWAGANAALLTAVPEPSVWSLTAIGIIAAFATRVFSRPAQHKFQQD